MDKKMKMAALQERAKRMKVDYVDVTEYEPDTSLCENIPFAFARQYKVVPLQLTEDDLLVATEDPTDLYVYEQLEVRTQHKINLVLGDTDDIVKAVEELYREITLQDLFIPKLSEKDLQHMLKMIGKETIDFFVNIVVNALKKEATDVHIETFQRKIRIRYRIDGVIAETVEIPKDKETQLASLIKSITGMKLEKRQIPQYGAFDIIARENPMIIRVATLPTRFGERFAFRIVDGRQLSRNLEELDLGKKNLEFIKQMTRHRQGLILVTGPSGSGISTTLYSIVRNLSSNQLNVITVEDPIEGDLPGVNQLEVNPKFDLDYPSCLRAVTKHIPDVIMVSRAMTQETVNLLIEASLTGQLVIAGLYAKDAINAITRLRDFGVEPYFITSSLVGVISQRLARMVCPHCSKSVKQVPGDLLNEFTEHEIEGPYNLMEGKGCTKCLNTGYRGRIGIYEVLAPTDTFKSMITRGSIKSRLSTQAQRDGMKTLYQDGLHKVARGHTTFAELKRVLID